MKKVCNLLLTALTCFAALTGCLPGKAGDSSRETASAFAVTAASQETDDPSLSLLRDRITSENCNVGIAFLSYVNAESTKEMLKDTVRSCSTYPEYPFLEECPIAVGEGQELYAIVPAEKKDRIRVFESGITLSGENEDYRDQVIFKGKPGEPVVLRCNLSEVYSNVLISVDKLGGSSFEFRPFISGMDGSIALESGCYDFTVYEADAAALPVSAYDLLLETEEVRYYTELGMILVSTEETQYIDGEECMIFALGTDREDQFVREFYYAVSPEGNMYFYDVVNDQWLPLGRG